MNQWDSFVTELNGSLSDLESCLDTAVNADHDELFWRFESAYLYMNMVEVKPNFGVGTTRVWSRITYTAFTDHMRNQVHAAFAQMKAVWDSKFEAYKSSPKVFHDRAEDWADLVPKLNSADQELRSSSIAQNWAGAGAQAYLETLPKQLSAMADMTTMAETARSGLASAAHIMASQYAWMMASFEQLASAVEDTPSGTYVRSTSLVYWLLDFGQELQKVASGVGQPWNSDLYPAVQGFDRYLDSNSELTTSNTWPVAANLDGDFTPTAPVGGGYSTTPTVPATPPTNPGYGPPTSVTVPGGYGGGPLDLETADGHTDTAGVNTQQY